MGSVLKRQTVIEREDIAELARKASILLAIEDAVDEIALELGIENPGYSIEWPEAADTIRVYIDADAGCLREKVVDDLRIEVVCRRTEQNIRHIYREIALGMARKAAEILRQYVFGDREYIAIVLDSGSTIVLEGEPGKVVVPWIPKTFFTCHTPPHTQQPLFSRKDVESLIEILANRGFGSCVVTPYACLAVYRCGPFTLNDYFKLVSIARDYGYADKDVIDEAGLESVEGYIFS